MLKNTGFSSLLAAGALALAISAPAYAEGKGDRAQKEIAAARAKVDSAKSMGASSELPVGVARAEEALKTAQEEASAGHKDAAIKDAIHAQAMADAALGEMQKRRNAAMTEQQQVAAEQTAAAQSQAAEAQNQASDANARAAAAQQAATQSAQSAEVARQQAAAAANRPTQVETTVTTQQTSSHPTRHRVTRKVVIHKARAPVTTSSTATTTTTTRSGPAY